MNILIKTGIVALFALGVYACDGNGTTSSGIGNADDGSNVVHYTGDGNSGGDGSVDSQGSVDGQDSGGSCEAIGLYPEKLIGCSHQSWLDCVCTDPTNPARSGSPPISTPYE